MNCRDLLRGTVTLPWLARLSRRAAAAPAAPVPFDSGTVRNLARQLASQPYKAPDSSLPDSIKDLDYQAYRSIRFDPGKAVWLGQGLNFTAEFFHRGYLYKDRVDIFEVANGQARPIRIQHRSVHLRQGDADQTAISVSPDFACTIR